MSKSLKNSCKLGPKPIKVALIHWLQIFHLCEKFILLHTKLFHKKGHSCIRQIYVVVLFYPWFNFHFPLFQTHTSITIRQNKEDKI